jgi:hypothetical protein
MDPERLLFQVFLSEYLSKAFVLVGYSLSDPNIRTLYHRGRDILAKREKFGKATYVVYPPKTKLERNVATEVWRQRGATYIPLSAVQFFEQLHRQALEVVAVEMAKKLMERLGIKERNVLDAKVQEILAVFPGFGSEEQVLLYLDAITRGGGR